LDCIIEIHLSAVTKVTKISSHGFEKKVSVDCSFLDGESTIRNNGLIGNLSAFIPILTFISGPAIGREIPLVRRQITLGRGDDCDFVIPDPSVSRKHLQIHCRKIVKSGKNPEMKVFLRDLGSKNGTLVNYDPVNKAILKPGDKIIMGQVILKFDHRDIVEQNFYDEIYRLATSDTVTSLLNKATITKVLAEEIAGSLRYRRFISVVIIDIDKFKGINDNQGHLIGDRVLQSAAQIIRKGLRRRDRVGRFGGDEFLLVLPETNLRGASKLAERIRAALETEAGADLEPRIKITASLGVASCRTDEASSEKLLDHADTALYRAKSNGRNRVQLWHKARNSEGTL
jgi:diguanylate cyclase (GGDEF)-like protein